MTGDGIETSTDGAMAIIRIDREPKLNAFTFAMIRSLRRAVEEAAANPAVAAIAISGTGRAFSAGLDMEDLARSSRGEGETADSGTGELPALFGFLLDVPKPVIGAINGVCAGGGMVLAMMCDLRFAADTASFTTAFSKRGLVAEHGTAWLLPRLMGTSRALDVLWSSRRFDAAEAYRMGFVDRLFPGESLLDEVRDYVDELAESVAPRSMATMKRQVYASWGQTIEASCADTHRLVQSSLEHPDAAEGVASFVDRRPPRFASLDDG